MLPVKSYIQSLGAYGNLCIDVARDVLRNGVNLKELSRQIVWVGVSSIPIVILTAIFSGMVIALQTAYGLHRFGAKNYVGNIVGLALVRELGPVLTAVMLAGRVGAGIAAEIGSMVVTEQVDAIRALGADPISKLVTPRVLAGLITMPLLVVLSILVGVYGGLVVAVLELNISAYTYYRSYMYTVLIRDVFDGLTKSAVFGFLVVSIACFKGMTCRGGTEGVGLTTTAAVVTGSVVVFIANFFLTKFLLLLTYWQ